MMGGRTVPSKYANLVAAAELVPVPPVFCLDGEFFTQELLGHAELAPQVDRLLDRMRATAGSALAEHYRELAALIEGAVLRADAVARLLPRLDSRLGARALQAGVAVRSAAEGEDGGARSYAGLYETVLAVKEPPALKRAIERVWHSYFRYPAVLERLKAGRPDSISRMNVLIQRMVAARQAGVAFTCDPVSGARTAVVEVVEGLGEDLVSGRSAGRTVQESDVAAGRVPADLAEPVGALMSALGRLEKRFGSDLDVEWAWDGQQLWILQIRPMTTGGGRVAVTAGPVLQVAPLFDASDEELEPFRPLDEFASYIRRKRGPLFRHGRALGVHSGGALIVKCNREGLADGGDVALSGRLHSDQVVIDSGPHLRQYIVARAQLPAELRAICARPGELHQLVIREFVRGRAGIISRTTEGGAVFCEMTDDGLLALNRGTAGPGARTFLLDEDRFDSTPVPAEDARTIWRFTRAAQEVLGPSQIEWVIARDHAHLVDYSALREVLPEEPGGPGRIISHGYATGVAVTLAEDDHLRNMSEGPAVSLTGIPELSHLDAQSQALVARITDHGRRRPVVFVTRPFAILAVLIPHVAGFVFDGASLLCHLAILLREHGVPALEVAGASVGAAGRVTLDTHAPIPLAFDGLAAKEPA
jgi:hypothetical protein